LVGNPFGVDGGGAVSCRAVPEPLPEPVMNKLSRRSFLLGTGSLPLIAPAHALGLGGRPGANDRITIGVIGIGIRGKFQIGNIPPDGRVVAVCDWYTPRMDFVLSNEKASRYAALLQRFRDEDAKGCAKFQDYRTMIETAKLDAVFITACDHHHVQAAMLACRAGMDVYVEKPLSVYVREGRALVEAAKKYKRIVQVGSQQRSMEMNQYACKLVREGGIGKVKRVTLRNYPGPYRFEEDKESQTKQDVPAGCDWDLYCGPTTVRPYHRRLWAKEELDAERFVWRGWDMFRDYSGHLMTNHGAHGVDMVQLALGTDDTGPVEVKPMTDGYKGEMRTCPVVMRYASGTELHFNSTALTETYEGEKGRLNMGRNRFDVNPPEIAKDPPDRSVLAKWSGGGGGESVARPHIQNWLDCVKSRKDPVAPLEVGHRSATICHLAGIARELKRALKWDPKKEDIVGDAEASALLDRPRRKGFELPT
jgi:predicted dehydrogenase